MLQPLTHGNCWLLQRSSNLTSSLLIICPSQRDPAHVPLPCCRPFGHFAHSSTPLILLSLSPFPPLLSFLIIGFPLLPLFSSHPGRFLHSSSGIQWGILYLYGCVPERLIWEDFICAGPVSPSRSSQNCHPSVFCIRISPSLHCDFVWVDCFSCFHFALIFIPFQELLQHITEPPSEEPHFAVFTKENRSVWNVPKNIFCFSAWVTSDFHQIW